jgi:hypothetical protein
VLGCSTFVLNHAEVLGSGTDQDVEGSIMQGLEELPDKRTLAVVVVHCHGNLDWVQDLTAALWAQRESLGLKAIDNVGGISVVRVPNITADNHAPLTASACVCCVLLYVCPCPPQDVIEKCEAVPELESSPNMSVRYTPADNNQGFEAQGYLQWISSHYGNLPDFTTFLQVGLGSVVGCQWPSPVLHALWCDSSLDSTYSAFQIPVLMRNHRPPPAAPQGSVAPHTDVPTLIKDIVEGLYRGDSGVRFAHLAHQQSSSGASALFEFTETGAATTAEAGANDAPLLGTCIGAVFDDLYGSNYEIPATLTTFCCAQLLVSSRAIHHFPKSKYTEHLGYLAESEEGGCLPGCEHLCAGGAHYHRKRLASVYERLWAVWLGGDSTGDMDDRFVEWIGESLDGL